MARRIIFNDIHDDDAIAHYKARWFVLRKQAGQNDYQQAKLLDEVRSCITAGASGDLQFKQWVVRHFHFSGKRAMIFVRLYRARGNYTEHQWSMLDGARGLFHIESLPTSHRSRVRETCIARIMSERQPLSYGTIRQIALRAGARSEHAWGGRPTQTEAERKCRILRGFIVRLYDEYNNLPRIPDDVQEAMGRSALEEVAAR